MPTTITVRDEMAGGQTLNEFSLDFLTEKITVRELIRSRVFEEVADHNANAAKRTLFRGLVQPDETERELNGFRVKKARQIDWETQFQKAIEAFQKNAIFIIVDDRQVETLDDEIEIKTDTQVAFVKLTPLVGG